MRVGVDGSGLARWLRAAHRVVRCGRRPDHLSAIAFIPKNDPVLAMANAWVNEVNSKLSGQLRLNYVGGPEVITRFQQIEALRTGVVDIAVHAERRLPGPDAGLAGVRAVEAQPSEERKSGFYDFMVEEHAKKINARYLGRVQISPFYLWTKKEPKTLADLRGLKMRSGVLYDRLMREFGMVPVTINAPEVYTALRSGIVDGFGWPVTGPLKRGWLDTTRTSSTCRSSARATSSILMNLDKWKACRRRPRTRCAKLTAEFEPRMVKHFNDEQRQRMEGDRRQGEEGQVLRRREQDLSRHRL